MQEMHLSKWEYMINKCIETFLILKNIYVCVLHVSENDSFNNM